MPRALVLLLFKTTVLCYISPDLFPSSKPKRSETLIFKWGTKPLSVIFSFLLLLQQERTFQQPDIDYDFDDGWNNERYYAGSGGGPRYKVRKKLNAIKLAPIHEISH